MTRTLVPSMRWSQLWVAAAVLLPLIIVAATPMNTIDLTYHLRAGAMAIDAGAVPRTDAFTFTAAGQPWMDQQWLSQVILASVFRIGGWFALMLTRIAMVGATLWLIYLACLAHGRSDISRNSNADNTRIAAWFTMVAAAFLLPTPQLRPQLFGVVLFAATLCLLVYRHRHPRLLWLIVPIVLLWTNIHGTFVLAIGLVGLAWIQDVQRRERRAHQLVLIGCAALAATLINPFGIDVWMYVFSLSGNPAVRTLAAEWQPTNFDSYNGAAFLVSLPLAIGLLIRARQYVTWPTLLSLATFAGLGFMAVRGVYWWGLVAPVILAEIVLRQVGSQSENTTSHDDPLSIVHTFVAGALIVVLMVICARWMPYRTADAPRVGLLEEAPLSITRTLQTVLQPSERMLSAQAWGSWFELALPDNPVAVDSRLELFPQDVWKQYAEVSSAGANWQQILREWQVRVVVVHARQQPLLLQSLVRDTAGWRAVYDDAEGAVFVRNYP